MRICTLFIIWGGQLRAQWRDAAGQTALIGRALAVGIIALAGGVQLEMVFRPSVQRVSVSTSEQATALSRYSTCA